MRERRRFHRYQVTLEVEYHFTNDVDIQSKTYTLNISEGGISIPLNKAVKCGKKINLRLKLPYEDREINAVGKVVWRSPLTKQNFACEEKAGVKFLDMDTEDKVALLDYIKDCCPA